MFTSAEIIDLAIRIEKNGEKFYRTCEQRINDRELKEVLLWLAGEEVDHVRFFRRLKNEIALRDDGDLLDKIDHSQLQDFMGDHVFSLDEVDLSSINDIQSLIRFALEFEQDTILFFDFLEAFVLDQVALDNLRLIMAEEQNHVRVLQDLLEKQAVS